MPMNLWLDVEIDVWMLPSEPEYEPPPVEPVPDAEPLAAAVLKGWRMAALYGWHMHTTEFSMPWQHMVQGEDDDERVHEADHGRHGDLLPR